MTPTIVKDIYEISSRLENRVEFSSITFEQLLICKHGQNVNDLVFIKSMFGIYFYTSNSAMEKICMNQKVTLPTYVCYEGSDRVFLIN